MVLRPTGGARFQRRTSTGGSTTDSSGTTVSAPYWVRLVRIGSTITGYRSSSGTSWTQVSSATVTMTSTVYVGLALTSHANTVLNTSTFDNVTVIQR